MAFVKAYVLFLSYLQNDDIVNQYQDMFPNVEKCSIATKLQETGSPEDILNWLLSTTATGTTATGTFGTVG